MCIKHLSGNENFPDFKNGGFPDEGFQKNNRIRFQETQFRVFKNFWKREFQWMSFLESKIKRNEIIGKKDKKSGSDINGNGPT